MLVSGGLVDLIRMCYYKIRDDKILMYFHEPDAGKIFFLVIKGKRMISGMKVVSIFRKKIFKRFVYKKEILEDII